MSEIDATFKPFEDHLDFRKTLQILKHATRGTDDGELFLEKRVSESLVFDDQKLRQSSFNMNEGFGIRSVKGEKTGFSHSSTISESSIKEASNIIEVANLGLDQKNRLASPPDKTNKKVYTDTNPFQDIKLKLKIDLLKQINEYARQLDNRVTQVTVSISAALQEIVILRPEGETFSDVRPMARINASVVLEENGRRETGSSGGGGRYKLSRLMEETEWQHFVCEAIRIADVNLRAEPAPAGEMDIVLGPGWPGVMLHEAVGHGLEADFNRKKTSAFSELLGKKVASKDVTVIDDGTIPNRRGSISIDDEGTSSGRNILIEEGKLVSYMQDRQNARLMGVNTTGNGRRESYAHPPMPRMTNTFMSPGSDNPQDILKSLKDGIYAVGFSGGQVDITNGKFVFSCTEAYRVKNGEIGAPVKGATLIGDGPTAMKNIQAVGNDLSLDPGIGTCGKGGQWVPVGVGQPTVFISGLTVGGSGTK